MDPEMKASTYEDILTQRHDRLGMTSGCNFKEYGDISICVATDDDNNGLWTSLVVVAEYMRYAVTKDPEALKTASRFFNGIVLLNEVTGVDGLMGRSCCSRRNGKQRHVATIHGYMIRSNGTTRRTPTILVIVGKGILPATRLLAMSLRFLQ